jgi:hypothetical protein
VLFVNPFTKSAKKSSSKQYDDSSRNHRQRTRASKNHYNSSFQEKTETEEIS